MTETVYLRKQKEKREKGNYSYILWSFLDLKPEKKQKQMHLKKIVFNYYYYYFLNNVI